MPGRYLRRKKDGLRDPTMTHVDDPYLYKVGDCIRSYEGWSIITHIEEIRTDLRFVTLAHFSADDDDVMLGTSGWYDFRPYAIENFHLNTVETGQRPNWTVEEVREVYERTMAEHMTGFIP